MNLTLTHSYYSACRAEVARFRNLNRETERSAEYFEWRYAGRPCDAEPVIVFAMTADGETAGSLSMVPHHYSVLGTVKKVGVVGDISVGREFRGKGIAGRMLAHLAGLPEAKSLAFNIVLPNPAVTGALTRAGWKKTAEVGRYARVLDATGLIAGKTGSDLLGRALALPLNALQAAVAEPSLPAGAEARVAEEADTDFDRLWEDAPKDGIVAGVRNMAYLNWRFRDHPLIDYRFLKLYRGDSLAAYAVYHLSDDGKYYLDDLFAPAPETGVRHMLSALCGHLRSLGGPGILVAKISGNDLLCAALRRQGFFKRDHQDLMTQPAGESPPAGPGAWFLTALDKDV